ncbi:hypothetical protein AArcSl_2897 [Halalkaliarchaeum desulfuricum]|uniref:Glutamate/valine-rich protein n=2 Tax=Halalkaliarchaeum desulfuricum TaxID=2055893 RepID=A0A343TN36_9EURY|nr:hypothetical protein AArcSl_2897 [Halalkaliarchaeum desulfuricum]
MRRSTRTTRATEGGASMKPGRVDFFVDLAYGLLIFLAVVFIFTGETTIGIAFGLGALVSYAIHVTWKMARFDPDWMTKEMTENIEETLTEEMTENVGEMVTEEVGDMVTEEVGEKVTEEVGEKVTEEVGEKVTEEVAAEVTETVEEKVTETVEEKVTETVDEKVTEGVTQEVTESVERAMSSEIDSIIQQLEAVNERIDRRATEGDPE